MSTSHRGRIETPKKARVGKAYMSWEVCLTKADSKFLNLPSISLSVGCMLKIKISFFRINSLAGFCWTFGFMKFPCKSFPNGFNLYLPQACILTLGRPQESIGMTFVGDGRVLRIAPYHMSRVKISKIGRERQC